MPGPRQLFADIFPDCTLPDSPSPALLTPDSFRATLHVEVDPRALQDELATLKRLADEEAPGEADEAAAKVLLKTPKGRHLSIEGKQEVLRRRGLKPQPGLRAIARDLGLSYGAVRDAVNSVKAPPREGMKTPGGVHLSDQGRHAILALHHAPVPTGIQSIANDLGLPRSMVTRAINADARARASLPAPASRPVVQVADWDEVVQRGWNAGDRFSLTIDDVPAAFEVLRHRQPGEAFDGRDFRPVIRGG